MDITLIGVPPEEVSLWRGSLGLLYCEAFAAPPWNEAEHTTARFLARLDRKTSQVGFRLVLALQERTRSVVGFAYGATSFGGNEPEPDYRAVVDAIGPTMTHIALVGAFEFIDLAVLPSVWGRGVEGRLHAALLSDTVHDRAWLMTRIDAAPARALYARRGWHEIGRFNIPGCDTERLILSRRLPRSR